MILAGDVGASNTRLGLFESSASGLKPMKIQWYRNCDYPALGMILADFLTPTSAITGACFGVAGPVIDGKCEITKCPWEIDVPALQAQLSTELSLINDMEAAGYGIASLQPEDILVLNPGIPDEQSNAAVIAAGTGLGETILVWNGARRMPLSAEAGHADFAANNDLETDLLCYLRDRFHHVSCDRVLSGSGLLLIYEFLRDTGHGTEQTHIAEKIQTGDPGAVISSAAMQGQCELCSQALDLFVDAYGAEAGNLALRSLARAGVYLAGGIGPKIRKKLQDGRFLRAFVDKGRMRPLLEHVPVYLILSEATGLSGAASFAYANLQG
jgi:glucokinase